MTPLLSWLLLAALWAAGTAAVLWLTRDDEPDVQPLTDDQLDRCLRTFGSDAETERERRRERALERDAEGEALTADEARHVLDRHHQTEPNTVRSTDG